MGSVEDQKICREADAPLAIIDKRRPKANVCEVMNIIGDVKGRRVVLVDDVIDTAGTIVNAANAYTIWEQKRFTPAVPMEFFQGQLLTESVHLQ